MQRNEEVFLSESMESEAEVSGRAPGGKWRVFPHKSAARPDKGPRRRQSAGTDTDVDATEQRTKHLVFPIKSASRDWRSGSEDTTPYLALAGGSDPDPSGATPRSLRALRARSNTARLSSRVEVMSGSEEFGFRAFGEVKSLEDWAQDERCPLSLIELQECVSAGDSIEDAIVLARIATYNQFGVAVGEGGRFRKGS